MFWRALFAFLALPGLVAFAVPVLWLWRAGRVAVVHPGGLALLAGGTAGLLWCVRDFYVTGKGTLAPWAPPRHLVVAGLYRFSRNPMYVSVVLMLLGWAVTTGTPGLFVYASSVAVAFHLRVVHGEEPWLARVHGDEWRAYVAAVPRWFGPRRRFEPRSPASTPIIGPPMIAVRAATPDDAAAIAAINVRSWRHAYRGIIPDSYLAELDEAAIARRVREVADGGTDSILVATDPEVRGFSWLSRSRDDDAAPGTAEIVAIYVDPHYERQGIGRTLALASCRVARSQGFTRIGLWVIDENTGARAFYEALDFAPDGSAKTSSRWGGVAIREVRYVRATTTDPEAV